MNKCLGFGNFQQKLCKGQAWQAAEGHGRAAGEGRRRRRARRARSEVLAAAVLGLGPRSCRCEHGWGWGERSLGQSRQGFGIGRDVGQGGGKMGVGHYVTEGWTEEVSGLVVEILGQVRTGVVGFWVGFGKCGKL